jgi:hypothetical protein
MYLQKVLFNEPLKPTPYSLCFRSSFQAWAEKLKVEGGENSLLICYGDRKLHYHSSSQLPLTFAFNHIIRTRIFSDLKFHGYPSKLELSVNLVHEYGVWMK